MQGSDEDSDLSEYSEDESEEEELSDEGMDSDEAEVCLTTCRVIPLCHRDPLVRESRLLA